MHVYIAIQRRADAARKRLRHHINKAAQHLAVPHIKPWDDNEQTDWWMVGTAIPLIAAALGPLANVMSIAALVTAWRMCLVADAADFSTCQWNGNVSSLVEEINGTTYPDPSSWALDTANAVSLALGFIGNIFLLFNFTGFVRYIIALPITIIMWLLASGILTGLTAALYVYDPPNSPSEIFSQGYWYAVLASAVYLIASLMLMLNMVGYFLGHVPQHFALTQAQQTLILQTMMFNLWLAAGGAIFSTVESRYGDGKFEWTFANGLYFSLVTILTVGFGDLYCTSNLGRGITFFYAVGGIVTLGLVITSISSFAKEIGADKVMQRQRERRRARTAKRAVSSELELREKAALGDGSPALSQQVPRVRFEMGVQDDEDDDDRLQPAQKAADANPDSSEELQSGDGVDDSSGRLTGDTLDDHGDTVPTEQGDKTASTGSRAGLRTTFLELPTVEKRGKRAGNSPISASPSLSRSSSFSITRGSNGSRRRKKSRLLLLKDERDRFNAMRHIETNMHKWQRYISLTIAVIAFATLWLLGALGFYYAEATTQNLSYFEALYFCYVSLLTIGYGDFAPQSNIGRPFFVVWSLIAVPTMTILVSAMSETVVESFRRGIAVSAEVTFLPRKGLFSEFADKVKGFRRRLSPTETLPAPSVLQANPQLEMQLMRSDTFMSVAADAGSDTSSTRDRAIAPALEEQAQELQDEEDGLISETARHQDLARRLANAIQRVAVDMRSEPPKVYSYEEWFEITRLIRFTTGAGAEVEHTSVKGAKGSSGWTATGMANDAFDEHDQLIEWDWIGENSPMMAKQTESQFIMDRLCESLTRYLRWLEMRDKRKSWQTGTGLLQAGGAIDEEAKGEGGGKGDGDGDDDEPDEDEGSDR